jgi:hypothetical protein
VGDIGILGTQPPDFIQCGQRLVETFQR